MYGPSDDFLADGVPLDVVGIEKAVGGRSVNGQGKLPAKVVGAGFTGRGMAVE